MNQKKWFLCLFLLVSIKVFSIEEPPEKPFDWEAWSFDQKINWRGQHLDPRIPYATLADKVLVKEWLGDRVETPKTLLATDRPEEISLAALPSSFMMKANNASGRGLLVKEGMIVARRKKDSSFTPIRASDELLQAYAREWLDHLYAAGTELQYGLIRPMILIEELLDGVLTDIQCFCFEGRVQLIEVVFRKEYKYPAKVSFYTPNWKLLKCSLEGFEVVNRAIKRPDHLDEIIALAEDFAQNIDHVRVDFSVAQKTLYFSEFTFTTGKGTVPLRFQKKLGRAWKFPEGPSRS